jgi:hypothetical protein
MIDYEITILQPPTDVVIVHSTPTITVNGTGGPPGIQGPPGAAWQAMTQAEFNALPVKDPAILYVII